MNKTENTTMQYSRPDGNYYVGDCMPFYHDGVFHLFYLLDENHHQGNNGLGGHQWAHVSSRDLKNWEHHEIAISLDYDWEGSICTGSLIFHDGMCHAFYATRKPDKTQHICHAFSRDCIHFEKSPANPILSAPPESFDEDFRDPFVFQDSSQIFHMVVTSKLRDYPLHDRGGCLLHYISEDLNCWNEDGIFLDPGGNPGYRGIPECPDIFCIGEWYYLLFGMGLETRYRMSHSPLGPWVSPANNVVGSSLCAVIKTAPWHSGRRIGVCWIGTRTGNEDNGWIQWGGNVVFREITQSPDGTLRTFFPPEMIPGGKLIDFHIDTLTDGAGCDAGILKLDAGQSLEVAAARGIPQNFCLHCQIKPEKNCRHYGVGLRSTDNFRDSYDLIFDPGLGQIHLAGQTIHFSDDLNSGFSLDIVCKDTIIDVCINNSHTIVNRLHRLTGDSFFFFCRDGGLSVSDIEFNKI